jgi:hypothetical protein
MRTTTNLREIESLLAVLDEAGERSGVDAQGRGFIAPFRAQVKLAGAQLPPDFVNDTVHKFQGGNARKWSSRPCWTRSAAASRCPASSTRRRWSMSPCHGPSGDSLW